VPLRVVPTFLFGVIIFYMMQLRKDFEHFIVYEVFLILLVMISTVVNLIMGMLTKNIMSGILIGVIVIMHFIMFTSLFISFGKVDSYNRCAPARVL
jgi:hypothetical protein